MTKRVLIVDDDRSLCETLAAGLEPKGFEVLWTTTPAETLDLLAANELDVVLTDLNMPGLDGIDLCARVVANRPDVPVILITAFGSLDTAVAAIRAGAYDFVTKPVKLDALVLALNRAVQHRHLHDEVKRLRSLVEGQRGSKDLIGDSRAMHRVQDLLERIADSETSVLITGESGTGKEVVARALHRMSSRRAAPFTAINCAAMPETLLESELFGHVRGAFTDARVARAGLFVQANGGTLLLDEIGDLPLALQPKLLRALQERVVRPLGGDRELPFDVRLIASTNRDLETAVEEGRFRQDLYFRIHVLHVDLPPLRARGADVLLLAQSFLEEFAQRAAKQVRSLSAPVAERLMAYSWPGNVRELRNAIEHAVALARYEQLLVEDLPERIRAYKRSHVLVVSEDPSEIAPLEEVERRYILRVVEAVGGNKTLAAQKLGIGRKTLYRKLEEYGYEESKADEPG